ncbi:MAG TPA: DUF6167 family protein [Nocardioides sp.]|nr:DUF6167 family protein [Nocardioides sp.]
MNRSLWFVAGAGVGIYGMIRARRAAEALTVDGMRDRVGAAVVGARMFRDEVAQGRADAESGLRERLGMVPDGTPELERSGVEAPSVHTSTTDNTEKDS